MKANELMYGDWIMFPDEQNKKVQVEALNLISIGYYGEGEHHFVPIERAAPIPLTAEILINNGFKDTFGNGNVWKNDSVEITVSYFGKILWTTHDSEYVVTEVYYVHTLQHILRLKGLNDLADNFKI